MIEGNAGTTLLDAVRKWPTPMTVNTTSDKAKFRRPTAGPSRGGPSFGLEDAVRGWSPRSGHWPTPDAFVSNDAEDPASFLARKEVHATRTDKEPTRAGVPLAIAAKWATPAARDGKGGFEHTKGGRDLSKDAGTWATPRATEGEKGGPNGRDGSGSLHLAAQGVSWATPQARDGKGGFSGHTNGGRDLSNDVAFWPTPIATTGKGSQDPAGFLARKEFHTARSRKAGVPLGIAAQSVAWPTPVASDGKGAQPIERPEGDDSLFTRVERTRGGNGLLLNPVFVEALMGWPLGWTDPTAPAGPAVPFPPPPNGDWGTYLAAFPGTEPAVRERPENRTDRLRACGNGVVPAQAAAAIGELLEALEVSAPAPTRGWRNHWRSSVRHGQE